MYKFNLYIIIISLCIHFFFIIDTELDNYQNNTAHITPCSTASSKQQRILPSKQCRPVSKEQINPKWKKRGVFVPKVHHFDTSKV